MIRYEPQLATLVRVPPDDDAFGCELKADGYRMSVQLMAAGQARLISRHGRGWSDSFPTIVQAAHKLPLKTALLDGELTVVLPNGLTSFEALQHVVRCHQRLASSFGPLTFCSLTGRIFDGCRSLNARCSWSALWRPKGPTA